jgi:hypothetical protein
MERCEALRRHRFVQARMPLEGEADFEPADHLSSSSVVEYGR